MTKMTNFDGGFSSAALMLDYIIGRYHYKKKLLHLHSRNSDLSSLHSWHENQAQLRMIGPTDLESHVNSPSNMGLSRT